MRRSASQRGLAGRRFDHEIALAAEPGAQEAEDRRLVVDDQHAERIGTLVMPRASSSGSLASAGTGNVIVNTAPLPLGAVRRA